MERNARIILVSTFVALTVLALVLFCAAGTLGFNRVANKAAAEAERPRSAGEGSNGSDLGSDVVVVDAGAAAGVHEGGGPVDDDERQRMLQSSEEDVSA